MYTNVNLTEAVEGADAVISVLRPTSDSPDELMTVAAENITEAMHEAGVSRLVTVVGGSIGWEDEQLPFIVRAQRSLLDLFVGETLADQENHVAQIRATDLDWTVIRAPFLKDGDATGEYRAGEITLEIERLDRADLARFLLDCVEDDRFVRELPSVGKARR